MTKPELGFVYFKPNDEHYQAFLMMEDILKGQEDPQTLLKRASQVYEQALTRMRPLIEDIRTLRARRQLVPARTVWQVGNEIFALAENLGKLSLQIDGLYDHLVRDLGVKRKWLEKVVIIRRYLPQMETIPESLNWGRFEKGTRRKAEQLAKGVKQVESK